MIAVANCILVLSRGQSRGMAIAGVVLGGLALLANPLISVDIAVG